MQFAFETKICYNTTSSSSHKERLIQVDVARLFDQIPSRVKHLGAWPFLLKGLR